MPDTIERFLEVDEIVRELLLFQILFVNVWRNLKGIVLKE